MNAKNNILHQKLDLIQWLSGLEDISIIQKIMDLRKHEDQDWWNSLSVDEKTSIEKGIEDAESGKLTSHSSAKKLYEKWL